MFAAKQALNAYSKVGVEIGVMDASPHKLILMLYEGARVAIASAFSHMRNRNMAAKGEAISKAIMIIDNGLRVSLNVEAGGRLAEQLDAIYEYMSNRLLQASLKNDPSILQEVDKLLAELQSAWEAIGKPSTGAIPAIGEKAPPQQPLSNASIRV